MAVRTKLEDAKAAVRERVRRDRRKAPKALRSLFNRLALYLFDATVHQIDSSWRRRKRFRDAVGMSVTQYQLELKKDVAKWLLSHTRLPLREIGRLLGDQSYNFSKYFLAWTGQNALEYRQAHRPVRDLGSDLRKNSPPPKRPLLSFSGDSPAAEGLADLLSRLLGEEVPTRQDYFLRHEIRFSNRALFDQLLDAARQAGRHDRRRGVDSMRLLLPFIEGSASSLGVQVHDLRVLALAWLGNAHRLANDFLLADDCFSAAETVASKAKNPATLGTLWMMEARLRIERRSLDEARILLDRALRLGRRANDQILQLHTLLLRVETSVHESKFTEASLDLRAARRLVDPETDPMRMVDILTRLAFIRLEVGNPPAARRASARASHIMTARNIDDPYAKLSIAWLNALIAQAEGHYSRAESTLRKVRGGFLMIRSYFEVALVSIDLAILCHNQGRTAETIELVATDIAPVLKNLRLPHQDLAAVSLLCEAVARRAVSASKLQSIRQILRVSSPAGQIADLPDLQLNPQS